MALTLKTAGDPLAIVPALREAIRSLDRNLPLAEIRTMDDIAATALARPRFATVFLAVLALLALTLAAIGTYATVSLLVSEGASEIGIRMAVGARRRDILGSVMREGLMLAVSGVGAGVGSALLVSRVLDALVFGVTTRDPATFVMTPAILFLVAMLASVLPARRAAALDPMKTLRQA
jgi:ABC-type antimicrobial peptide transport system permease subunit